MSVENCIVSMLQLEKKIRITVESISISNCSTSSIENLIFTLSPSIIYQYTY
jgi:hypothetical protein